ncbi:uncharacterized protein BDZ99DRAFT_431285 [Mytilinidion resinicola]|uniref:N-acetyltransferase domain-containing protein n=1 Tax=Mytilinidion resinicola TaxID=574789 RepID=A0A6A6Z8F1_9PEZI|nr:uncharacterized protein BDZ99DRAFT_431285 [Mytilinidion resinicola]KAF2817296.1 hypothetical protein BDZ99DRAFT_431285 [Mytilinidion resinicola]
MVAPSKDQKIKQPSNSPPQSSPLLCECNAYTRSLNATWLSKPPHLLSPSQPAAKVVNVPLPYLPYELTTLLRLPLPKRHRLRRPFAHGPPVITYLLNVLSPFKQDPSRHMLFNAVFTAAALNGASFAEADGWRCVGVLMAPGKSMDNPLTLVQSGLFGVAWNLGVNGVWGRVSPLYVSTSSISPITPITPLLLTPHFSSPSNLKQGLSTHLIHHFQSLAAATHAPIWLKATTASWHALYGKLGFKTVGEIALGQGVAGADGSVSKGGEGVRIWGMVWCPAYDQEELCERDEKVIGQRTMVRSVYYSLVRHR